MHISLLTLNGTACLAFTLLHILAIKSESDKFVSAFWADIQKKTSTRAYRTALWSCATLAWLPSGWTGPMLSQIALMCVDFMRQGDLLAIALVLTVFWVWFSATAIAALFSILGFVSYGVHVLSRVFSPRSKAQIAG